MTVKAFVYHMVLSTLLLYSLFSAQLVLAQNFSTINPEMTQSTNNTDNGTIETDEVSTSVTPPEISSSVPIENETLYTEITSSENQQNTTLGETITIGTVTSENTFHKENDTVDAVTVSSPIDNSTNAINTEAPKLSTASMQNSTESNEFNQTTDQNVFALTESPVPEDETIQNINATDNSTTPGLNTAVETTDNVDNTTIESNNFNTSDTADFTTVSSINFNQTTVIEQFNETRVDAQTNTDEAVTVSTQGTRDDLVTQITDTNMLSENATQEVRDNAFTESPSISTEQSRVPGNQIFISTDAENATIEPVTTAVNFSETSTTNQENVTVTESTLVFTDFNKTESVTQLGETLTEPLSDKTIAKVSDNNSSLTTSSPPENTTDPLPETESEENVTNASNNVTMDFSSATEGSLQNTTSSTADGFVTVSPSSNFTMSQIIEIDDVTDTTSESNTNFSTDDNATVIPDDVTENPTVLRSDNETNTDNTTTVTEEFTVETVTENLANETNNNVSVTTATIFNEDFTEPPGNETVITSNTTGYDITTNFQNITSENVTEFEVTTVFNDSTTMVTVATEFENATEIVQNQTENMTEAATTNVTTSVDFSNDTVTVSNNTLTESPFFNSTEPDLNVTSLMENATDEYFNITTTESTMNLTDGINVTTESIPVNATRVDTTHFENATSSTTESLVNTVDVPTDNVTLEITTLGPEEITSDNTTGLLATMEPNITESSILEGTANATTDSVSGHTENNITDFGTTESIFNATHENISAETTSGYTTSYNVTEVIMLENVTADNVTIATPPAGFTDPENITDPFYNNVTVQNTTEEFTSALLNVTPEQSINVTAFSPENVTSETITSDNTTAETFTAASFDNLTSEVTTENNFTDMPFTREGNFTEMPFTTEGNVTEMPFTTEGNVTDMPFMTEGNVTDMPFTTEGNVTDMPFMTEGNVTDMPFTTEGNATDMPFTTTPLQNMTDGIITEVNVTNEQTSVSENITLTNFTEGVTPESTSGVLNFTSVNSENNTADNVTETTFTTTEVVTSEEMVTQETFSVGNTIEEYNATTESMVVTTGEMLTNTTIEEVTNATTSGITTENVINVTAPAITTDEVTNITAPAITTDEVTNVTAPAITTDEVTNVTAPGITTEEVTNVTAPGVTTEEVTNATTPGITTEEVTNVTTPGITTDEVTNVTAPGITTEEVTNVTAPGITTEDITNITAPGTTTEDVTNVTAPGITVSGITTEEVTNITAPGITTEEVTNVTAPGITTEEVTNVTVPGITTADVSNVISPGITTEEMTNVTTPGITTIGTMIETAAEQVSTPENEITSSVEEPTTQSTTPDDFLSTEESTTDKTTVEVNGTTHSTTPVEVVTKVETTEDTETTDTPAMTTDSNVTPSSTPMPPTILPSDIIENLMAMTIKPRWGDDLKSDALKKKYEEGLLHAYLAALFGANLARKKRELPPNPHNLSAKVTSIDSNKDGTADVNFYMSSADGSLVPADTATAVYNRLHPSDVSAYIGAQVVALPEPVKAKAPTTADEDDGVSIALIVAIILGVMVLLCLVAIVIMCYRETHRKQTPQDIHMHNYSDVRKDILPPYSGPASMEAGQLQSPPQSVIVNGLPMEVTREAATAPTYSANESDSLRAKKLAKKLARYDQMPDDNEESLPRIVSYKNKAYEGEDEVTLVHTKATTSARKPKDEDSLSVTERSLDVQPRNRIPRSKQRVRGQGHKPGKDYTEVKEIDASIVSAEYDTQSQSSMESTHSAGMFEHVAKMSRLTDPKPTGPALPPVRFRHPIQPLSDLASLPPLQNSVIPNDTEPTATSSESEYERKKHKADIPPVKLRSNVTGSRQRKSSLASSESILDQADREKQRNKQRQRELERQYGKENGNIPNNTDESNDRERRKKEKKKRKDRKERTGEHLCTDDDEDYDTIGPKNDREEKKRHSKSPSSAARKLQESKDKRWKKSPKGSSDSHHGSSKLGRNMRAAPRRSSSARSSETGDTVRSARHQIKPGMYELLPHNVGPLKQKRRKRHTFSHPPTYQNLNSYSPASTMSLDSSLPTVSETEPERSLSPNQINFQLTAMPKTDIQNSYGNPKSVVTPREWVLPQVSYPHTRPTHRAVRPTAVVPRNKPGYRVLATVGVGSSQPALFVGPNGRYYQQIPRYGASSSPPERDNNPTVRTVQEPVARALRPQASPMMSTVQENNQTTHFMVPPTNQYEQPPSGIQPLINNYPALNPIYTMITNSGERTPPTNTNLTINHVQGYAAPTSLPTTCIPTPVALNKKSEVLSPGVDNSQSNSLEREISKFEATPVTMQPQNPPDIISVLANPKAAMTPIVTASGPIEDSLQPNVHASPSRLLPSNQKFVPSANGAFKPPPPRVKSTVKDRPPNSQVERPSTPTYVPYTVAASQSIWSAALDNKKRCSPSNKSKDSPNSASRRNMENSDNSSLDDFANELGNSFSDSANEDMIENSGTASHNVKLKIKNHHMNPIKPPVTNDTPPIPPRSQKSKLKNASVVHRPVKDPTKQQLLEQLALQQAVHDQHRQLRQTAQQLINEAHQQQQENLRMKRGLESVEATRLLDDAFPLVRQRHSAPASPPSPPNHSYDSAPQSDSKGVPRPRSRKSKRPKTALEKLLSDGSLSGLPPQYSDSPSTRGGSSPNSVTRNAWEVPKSPTAVSPPDTRSEQSNIRSAAEVISRGLNGLSPREKKMLLQAIRSELQAMQPPSAEN